MRFAAEGKRRPSAVFPKKRASYKVQGERTIGPVSVYNDRFAALTSTKPSPNASASIPLEELRRQAANIVALQEAQSFSFWLVSALFEHIRQSGVEMPNQALFDRFESSLATALTDQAHLTCSLSSFNSLNRRLHYLRFAPLLSEGQKSRLLGSSPFRNDLFDPSLLEEVIKEFQNSQATSSHISVSKAVAKGFFFSNKRKREDSKPAPNKSTTLPSKASTNAKDQNQEYEVPPKANPPRGRGNPRGGRVSKGRGKGGRGSQNFQS